MGTWFWLNIPLALLFVCCWAGIPMWHTFKRWDAELKAKEGDADEAAKLWWADDPRFTSRFKAN